MKIVEIMSLIAACIIVACGGSDNEPPIVQITTPVDNSMVGGTVTVSMTATDNEVVERVELFIDNTLAATLSVSPYIYSWITDSLINNSTHTLVATAYDVSENASTPDTVTVEVFNDTTGISIYIWLFDPLDRFYDIDVGDSVDCAYWLEQTILANGYTPEKGTMLPSDLNGYDIIFVTLGWFRC